MKKIYKILGVILVIGIVIWTVSFISLGGTFNAVYSIDDGQFTLKELEFEAGESFSVTAGSGSVKLVKTDAEKIKVTYYESEENGISVRATENGIDTDLGFSKKQLFAWPRYYDSKYGAVTVEVPSGLKTLSAKVGSGTIDVRGISCTTLNVTVSSGTVNLNSVQATTVNVEASSGAVNLNDINAQALVCEVSSGVANITSTVADTIRLGVRSGSVRAKIKAKRDDYSCSFTIGSGKGYLNGKDFSGTDGTAKVKTLTLTCKSGVAYVDFTE